MSSIKDVIDQHEPMKKHMCGKEEKIMHVMTIVSTLNATKYPHGVRHSNGNLMKKNHLKFINKIKSIRYVILTQMEWAECMIHGLNHKCNNLLMS